MKRTSDKKSVKMIHGSLKEVEIMDCVSWADRISKVIWLKLYLISVRDFFSLVFLSSFSEGTCFLHTVEKTLAYFFSVKSTYKFIRPLEP